MAMTVLGAGIAANAAIDGSAHDFRGDSWFNGGAETQLCAPCHAPHGSISQTVPLWNHETTAPASFTTYTSPTMDAATTDPVGSSLACLSCHDGSLAVDNAGGATMSGINAGAQVVGAGGDLSHEHPIGFTYADSSSADTGIKTADATITSWLIGGQMECASCHDAHNGGSGTKLLHISNDASALCLTCHDK